MLYHYTKLTFTLILFSLSGLIFPALAAADGPTSPTLRESTAQSLTLDWQLPDYAVSSSQATGTPYSLVTIPDLPLSEQPGRPQLPVYNTLIGLPPTGGASVRIINIKRETIQLKYPVLPAATPLPVHLDSFNLQSPNPYSVEPDKAIYAANAFYPSAAAQLGKVQQIRHQRVARLTINPVQVNPVTGEATIIRSLTVEVAFDQPADLSSDSAGDLPKSNPFSRVLANTLLNPEALGWTSPTNVERVDTPRYKAGNQPFKVIVTEPGLYALTYSDLQQAGLPVDTLNPATLKMTHGADRRQVAIQVETGGDHNFDRILFYAAPDFSRYTDQIIYFLDYGGAVGVRMATRAGNPAGLPAGTPWLTAAVEEDHKYDSLFAARNGDHWYWASLHLQDSPTLTFTLPLASPLDTASPAALTLWFHGRTSIATHNPDHRVAVSVNGAAVGEVTWDGYSQPITATFTVAAPALQNGDNQIGISLPGVGVSTEEAWFDAMSLTYAGNQAESGQHRFTGEAGSKAYAIGGVSGSVDTVAVYDITQPFTPQIVSGYTLSGGALTVGDADTATATYLIVPNSQIKTPIAITSTHIVSDPPGGAGYIIITHPDFAGAVAPLAAHRQAMTGTQVVTVDVTAIYDTFGDGRMDAEAIKTYLQHAWDTWTPQPSYVLLVGDGQYDFKDSLGWGNPNFIPPYLKNVDPWLGETASDNRLVTLAGSDNLPDMMIGRLSVTSVAEAETVVDKIIHYETDPPIGGWNARHLFVGANPKIVDFHKNADRAYDALVDPLAGYRHYYASTSSGSLPYRYTNVQDLRRDFFNRYNAGAGVTAYHGHSSIHMWASQIDAPEELLHLNDVSSLHNGYRTPIMLEMTCFTGFFHHPEYPTLDESLVRHSGGGAVAVWGATGLGFTKGHDKLQDGFYDTVIKGVTGAQPIPTLGQAILAGKVELDTNFDLLDTFTLFGDPAMTINLEFIPFPEHIYLPVIIK